MTAAGGPEKRVMQDALIEVLRCASLDDAAQHNLGVLADALGVRRLNDTDLRVAFATELADALLAAAPGQGGEGTTDEVTAALFKLRRAIGGLKAEAHGGNNACALWGAEISDRLTDYQRALAASLPQVSTGGEREAEIVQFAKDVIAGYSNVVDDDVTALARAYLATLTAPPERAGVVVKDAVCADCNAEYLSADGHRCPPVAPPERAATARDVELLKRVADAADDVRLAWTTTQLVADALMERLAASLTALHEGFSNASPLTTRIEYGVRLPDGTVADGLSKRFIDENRIPLDDAVQRTVTESAWEPVTGGGTEQ